jgi:TRAP-type C4-dicarboxylate transport system permease small subunit
VRLAFGIARKIAELAAVLAFAAMLGAFLLNIVARYVFDAPLGWPDELAAILFVWIVFWTGALLVPMGQHIRFALLRDVLGPRWRVIVDSVAAGAFGLLYVAAAPTVIDYLIFASDQHTSLMEISMAFVHSSFAIFFVVIALRCLFDAVVGLRSLGARAG